MHNWDDFRYFRAVADKGSYSLAAKELGVNHSTVSRRIQVLEQRHGVRLFERSHNGYDMTEAGASIYDIVEQIHEQGLKASRVLLGRDARLEGKITITMPHDIFDFILAPAIKEFCEQYPAIDLNLLVSKGLRNLAQSEADIAVRLSPSPPDYLVGKQITHLQHGIYANPTVVQALTEDNVAPGSIPLIVWSQEAEPPSWARRYFPNSRIALRVDDLFSMHQAVKAGIGIARMPCFMPSSVQAPEVKRLDITLPPSDWGVWLLSHVDLRNTARINQCRAFLEQKLTDMTALFTGEA